MIMKILAGNTNLYGQLVNLYSKMCFSVAYKIIQDVDETEDIVQESFISAYEYLSSIKGESKFSTWIYRIVMNKAIAHKNKQKFFDEVDNQGVKDEEYDTELESSNTENLKKALAILNEKERLVIELFYYQEQSIREVSQICDTSEANIKVLLHRARKKMNELLTKNGKFAHNE